LVAPVGHFSIHLHVLLALALQVGLLFVFAVVSEKIATTHSVWIGRVGQILFPGITIFWEQGFHDSSGILGLVFALTFNLIYYVFIILAIRWLCQRSRAA
jgi:hypothetical protein